MGVGVVFCVCVVFGGVVCGGGVVNLVDCSVVVCVEFFVYVVDLSVVVGVVVFVDVEYVLDVMYVKKFGVKNGIKGKEAFAAAASGKEDKVEVFVCMKDCVFKV